VRRRGIGEKFLLLPFDLGIAEGRRVHPQEPLVARGLEGVTRGNCRTERYPRFKEIELGGKFERGRVGLK
jgi:hypothetical protein